MYEPGLITVLGYKAKQARDEQMRIWNSRRNLTTLLHDIKLLCKTHEIDYEDFMRRHGIEGADFYEIHV